MLIEYFEKTMRAAHRDPYRRSTLWASDIGGCQLATALSMLGLQQVPSTIWQKWLWDMGLAVEEILVKQWLPLAGRVVQVQYPIVAEGVKGKADVWFNPFDLGQTCLPLEIKSTTRADAHKLPKRAHVLQALFYWHHCTPRPPCALLLYADRSATMTVEGGAMPSVVNAPFWEFQVNADRFPAEYADLLATQAYFKTFDPAVVTPAALDPGAPGFPTPQCTSIHSGLFPWCGFRNVCRYSFLKETPQEEVAPDTAATQYAEALRGLQTLEQQAHAASAALAARPPASWPIEGGTVSVVLEQTHTYDRAALVRLLVQGGHQTALKADYDQVKTLLDRGIISDAAWKALRTGTTARPRLSVAYTTGGS